MAVTYQQTILDNQEQLQRSSFVPRDYVFASDLLNPHLKKIIAYTGPRRAGKTTLMKQALDALVQE